MSFLDGLSFDSARRLPMLLQTEATECGLACIAMIAGYHGFNTDVATLRQRFSISLKGATLVDLTKIAARMHLGTRPLRLDLQHLAQLELPCVLHWNLNHFVVLKEVNKHAVIIHDPARGARTVSMEEVSKSFTGVALEMWPDPGFVPKEERQTLRLHSLIGHISGLSRSVTQILVLALSLEVFSLVNPFFLQWIVDNVLVSADRGLLATLAIGFGLLLCMQHAVTWTRSWILIYMSTTLSVQWRANILSHLLRLPVQYFEKRHVADVVSRAGAVDEIQRILTTSFLEAVLDGLMTIVIVGMMLVYSPMLTSVSMTVVLLYALARWVFYGRLRDATEKRIIHSARQQSHFLETVRGIKVLKLFQRQEQRRSGWLALLIDEVNADIRARRLELSFKTMNGLLFGLENVIILWLGSASVLDGNFSVGVLLAFVAYKNQFGTRVIALIDKGFELKMLRLHAERLADIVLTAPEPSGDDRLCASAGDAPIDIEVRGLSYRYSDNEPYVLEGVDLTIDAGQSVAIVGPSGCGKSTLLNLLLGILAPTEGDVLIGGENLQTVGVDYLRGMSGTVLQDDVLFAGSIADNISFFDASPDRDWIAECARLACIAEDIVTMPMGYHTLVGDMGTILSGGQKQRILLARALYKRPRILFLDEATSHLDVALERQVNQAIRSLNITRVIIAHRPETIASADRIIELPGRTALQRPARPPSREIAAASAGDG